MSSFDLFVVYMSVGTFIIAIGGIAVSSLWESINKKYRIMRKEERRVKITEKESRNNKRGTVRIAHNNGIIDIRMSKEAA